MKRCTVCLETKPFEEFVKHRRYRDGYYSRCKTCANAAVKAWRQANPAKLKESAHKSFRKYYTQRREVTRARQRAWASRNREHIQRKGRDWYAAHREIVASRQLVRRSKIQEKLRQQHREYYARNRHEIRLRDNWRRLAEPDRFHAYERKWRDKNRGAIKVAVKNWRAKNYSRYMEYVHRRRARHLGAFVEPVDRDLIYDRDNGLCGICGGPVEKEQMSIDHIMPLALGGTHQPSNVQLAHRRCNSRKGIRLIIRGGQP